MVVTWQDITGFMLEQVYYRVHITNLTILVMKDVSDHHMAGMAFKDTEAVEEIVFDHHMVGMAFKCTEVVEEIEKQHHRLSKPMSKALTTKESSVHKMIIEIFKYATE